MLRDSGAIVLPFGAKLTPAAQDLVRARKLEVRYDLDAGRIRPSAAAPSAVLNSASPGAFLWWSGVKSGSAKAAIAMSTREANLRELSVLEDATKATAAVRLLIGEVKAGTAAGGILIVEHSGLATLLANRSPHLRAVVGSSLAAVDAGLRDIAANVLVIEPGNMPLMVLRNMMLKFVRSPRTVSEELSRQLAEAMRS